VKILSVPLVAFLLQAAAFANTEPVLGTEAEWTQNFTYWPMPFIEFSLVDRRYRLMQLLQPLGLYRLSLDPQGKVTEIKILRRMGSPFDVVVLKTLINWKAKPTAARTLTIFMRYGQKHRVATATQREWGFAPGRL
jgi:hypothetical protein